MSRPRARHAPARVVAFALLVGCAGGPPSGETGEVADALAKRMMTEVSGAATLSALVPGADPFAPLQAGSE